MDKQQPMMMNLTGNSAKIISMQNICCNKIIIFTAVFL